MAVVEGVPSLQPGFGFRLQPNGQWRTEKIPQDVVDSAEFSGYLTIMGYRCTVFETPELDQWAQKSVATAAEPAHVSAYLRWVASYIDSSDVPSRKKVAASIRTILSHVCDGFEVVCPDGIVRHYPYHNEGDAESDARLSGERGCSLSPEPTPLEASHPPCPEGEHSFRPVRFKH